MSDPDDNPRAVYQELCNSYRAIDDFRSKLLGFLPLASGTGVFLLLDKFKLEHLSHNAKNVLMTVGGFGLLVTFGLFAYEIYGIKKCHALIRTGVHLEGKLCNDGQFVYRPREVLGFINEPFAAGIIYPAVLAAWAFLMLVRTLNHAALLWIITGLIFLGGLVLSLFYNFCLAIEAKVRDILEAKPDYKEAKNGLSTWDLLTSVTDKADRQKILSEAISKGFLPIAHDLNMACAIFGEALCQITSRLGGVATNFRKRKG